MSELSGVWRTADISRSSLMHRSIPIIVKAIVNVVFLHYQLQMWLLSKAVTPSAALWWQIWRFNHTVIVCLVRFFLCIVWGQNKKGGTSREEVHIFTIHRINSFMACCSKLQIDWVFAINALWKGQCMERRLAKSLPLPQITSKNSPLSTCLCVINFN